MWSTVSVTCVLAVVFIGQIQAEQPALCALPAETGDCKVKAYFTRFYYDQHTQSCRRFTWGGCGGNENNFETRAACETECLCSVGSKPPAVCRLPPTQTGNCRANKPRWHYHESNNTCSQFTYGGCGGNGNNFVRGAKCHAQCVIPSLAAKCDESNGKKSKDRKGRKSRKPKSKKRFIYNIATGECEESKSVCDGYTVRFKKQAECERSCKK